MNIETIKFFFGALLCTFIIFGMALTLTGCEVARYAAKCTLVQPENCN